MKFKFFSMLFFALLSVICIIPTSKAVTTDTDVAISSNYIYDQESTSNSRALNDWQGDMGQGPVRKLGRGICNAVFGVFEIPIQVYETNQTTGGFAAWTYGLCKGVGRFVLRELVGVTEVVTFFMPLPGCSTQKYGSGWGYGPLMEPEWVFDFDTDPYNTVYPSKPPM
ncbi:MAG TPA: hypothetical protein DD381_04200 [Lentisphaeria bacterium]|nr:MAG: hypothetical protein A2X47_06430 [Lentisphaerae bacterium GWF2_38_69]HBM15533.1 hypothetical protein [Lentisphaeria bacterium]